MKKHLAIITTLLLVVAASAIAQTTVQITSPPDGSRISSKEVEVGILFSTTDPVPARFDFIAYDNGTMWTYGFIQLVVVQEMSFTIPYQTKVRGAHVLELVFYNGVESVTNSITVFR
jgi:hypothetical protein